jgi:hypothetical protein
MARLYPFPRSYWTVPGVDELRRMTEGVVTETEKEPYFMPAGADMIGPFGITCPGCGEEVQVRGMATGLRIVDHMANGVVCDNSDREIERELTNG